MQIKPIIVNLTIYQFDVQIIKQMLTLIKYRDSYLNWWQPDSLVYGPCQKSCLTFSYLIDCSCVESKLVLIHKIEGI